MSYKKLLEQALYLVLVFTLLFCACSGPFDSSEGLLGQEPSGSATYETTKGDTTYKLTVTQSAARSVFTPAPGDTYVLLIITAGETKTSSGTISAFSNGLFTLKPANATVTFTVQTNSEGSVTSISGTITLKGSNDTVQGPGSLSPGKGGGGGGGGSGGGSTSPTNPTSPATPNPPVPAGTGSSVNDPITVSKTGLLDYPKLLAEIEAEGKYVNLDLSACTMSGTEFELWRNLAGTDFVVFLTLPDSALSATAEETDFSRSSYKNLKTVRGANVISIGDDAFRYCGNLAAVTFPAVTSIGEWTFSDCMSLTSVDFPKITSIGRGAFYGCTSLASVSFPSATSIGESAFEGCTSLASVSFPSATSIGESAFSSCTNLASASFPLVTSIGYSAFVWCSLTSVSFPLVTSIDGQAFLWCRSLASVSFPAVTSIGNSAFDGCTSLASVSFPASLAYIGPRAFASCSKLASFTCFATEPPIKGFGLDIFYSTPASLKIYVPAASVAAYQAPPEWSVYADKITAIQ